ncbi:MAG: hypothetical protein ATN36_04690 [Epulopiscium sp. Nele67-Bin005]|nr:MAG: hypothetical protein ATN36_04690 [Epulopiscium sp. Nele67-Bin005]
MDLDSKIITQIQQISMGFSHILKVILFGSRVRMDNSLRSDIDLLVYSDEEIYNFIEQLEEIETLLIFDVVLYNSNLEEGFLNSIAKEGVNIYEKSNL